MQQTKVWDKSTRIFHWINFLSILGLISIGLIMLNRSAFGFDVLEAKIALKELHVYIGYVFALNLLWRLVRLFIGGHYSRWAQVFPGRNFVSRLKQYLDSEKQGKAQPYAGHNPAGKLAVALMFALFTVLAVTGLIRAGTDVYLPPFGGYVASYVAADGVPATSIKPYDKTGVNADRMAAVKNFKSPFGKVHIYAAYTLMLVLCIHIFFVVYTELTRQPGIISAMFSGKKYFDQEPVDKIK